MSVTKYMYSMVCTWNVSTRLSCLYSAIKNVHFLSKRSNTFL